MTEDAQAKLLAIWLQSPPGTPAPEGIDDDVLAGVYALRPDRAPAPTTTIADVLAGVESGPLAAPRPKGGVRATRGLRRPERPPERAPERRRSPWSMPGVGLVITAAAAALFAIRAGGGLSRPSPELDRLEVPAPMAAAPEPASEAAAPDAADAAAPSVIPEATGGGAAPNAVAQGAKLDGALAEGGRSGDASPARQAAAAADAAASPVASGALSDAAGLSRSAGAPAPAEAPLGAADLDASAAAAAPAPPPTAAPGYGAEAEAKEKAERAVADEERASPAPKKASSRASAAASPAAPSASSPASPSASSGAASSAGSGSPGLAPDYNPAFYAAYPDISAAYARAVAAESAGRWSDALAAYAPFLAGTRADLAQDAALRAARCLRALGRADDALSTVQTGLRRSSANTPYRSNLLTLDGDLLAAAGRTVDAEKAWSEARRLNAAR